MATTTLGKVSVTPKGAWNGGLSYSILDIVTYNGGSYIAKKTVPANTQINNAEYWLNITEKGNTGDAAGFGTPTASASTLPVGSSATVEVSASGSDTSKIFAFAFGIPTGATGATGNGISSISKTSTSGLVDTYTITFTDGTTTTFDVTNGTSELESTTGQSTVKGMTQKAITDEVNQLNEDIVELETDLATQTRINTKQEREITNLKQQAPADTVVNYPDTTYGKGEVPTSVCKYAEVNKINGCSRVWNQLVKNGNFADTSEWSSNDSAFSVSNNIATFIASARYGYIYQMPKYITIVNGHKYILSCDLKTTTANNLVLLQLRRGDETANLISHSIENTTNWQSVSEIYTSDYSGVVFIRIIDTRASGWDSVQVKNCMLIDLTLLYGSGSEPTTVAQFKADYPLPYYAYNAGEIKSSTLTAFNSKGVNIWDEEWEEGCYDTDTGNKVSSANLRCKNYISILAGQTYYFKTPTDGLWVLQYDADKNYLGGFNFLTNADKTFNANVAYITFYTPRSYGTTYNHDIQICLNSVSTKTTYHPYNAHSTSLPQAITLKSAGTAKDEHVPSTGAVTRNIGMVDLGSLNWTRFTAEAYPYFKCEYFATEYNAQTTISSATKFNGVCAKYITGKSDTTGATESVKEISLSPFSHLYVIDSTYTDSAAFKAAMNGVMLYYELATPTSESVTPIDDFIEVEAEGEMSLTHTETPAMDSRFTVTYANLS